MGGVVMEMLAPATWSLEQVRQVSGLRCALAIDEMLFERDADNVMQAARERLAKRIVHDCHPFGVEVHPADVDFHIERPARFPAQVMVRAAWRPSTKVVEFRGGVIDGKRLTVQKVGDSILMPVLAESPWLSTDTGPTTTIESQHLRYELSGWSERERHWVYETS